MQEMILSDEFRKYCRINIRRRGLLPRIFIQGLTEEDYIDIVVSYAWRCNNGSLALSTIADKWVKWCMSRITPKKIPLEEMRNYQHSGFKDIDNRDQVDKLLKSGVLSGSAKEVLQKRFFEGKTFLQIGMEVNLTKERVRQILNESIEKLRIHKL
jgi:hypothetical protein